MRQEKRTNQISEIRNSIKKVLDEKIEISFEDITLATMSNLGLSLRTSQEYIKVALYQLGTKKEDLWKPKKI
jgi:hypothetical protein